ncbi:hypothetical protein ES702_02258 [subsurface metagenome]
MEGFDKFGSQPNYYNPASMADKVNILWKKFQESQEPQEIGMTKESIRLNILQSINDQLNGGLTSRNLASFRTNYVFNEADSLDADHPFIMDFEIIDECIKIFSAKVSFKIKKYRAYSTGAAEKSAVTSGASSEASSGVCSGHINVIDEDTLEITAHNGGYLIVEYGTVLAGGYNHIHGIAHNHSIPAHSHDITFGIHEEDTSPTIHFWITEDPTIADDADIWKGKHGGYTTDQKDLDITRYLTSNGDKMLKFTSDVRCRISACVLLKLDIKARG